MKATKQELLERNAQLERTLDPYQLALADIINGDVIWFGRAPTKLGISRPCGAAGGIAIEARNGMISACYWEPLRNYWTSYIPAGSDSENIAWRELIFQADRFVQSQQAARS